MRTLLLNANIVNEGATRLGHILIENEIIAAVGYGGFAVCPEGADETLDLKGALVMPGAIDTHVHFRDPGLTEKGDLATESAAAVAGGVTSVFDMPNTKPQTVSAEAWEEKMRGAEGRCRANYAFYVGATNDNVAELRSLDWSRVPGIKLFMGSSTGGMLVNDDAVLDEIFSLGRLVAVHSEDEGIIRANLERIKNSSRGDAVSLHPEIRSEEACVKCTRRAIDLAVRHSARLHILHLSTAKELEMALNAGENVTTEVCASYLVFCDTDYDRLGARIKCNPAIKTAADRDALRRAVGQGKVTCVSTDHAPHLWAQKEGGVFSAASGMPGVQHSLPLMLTLADRGHWSRERVAEAMAHNPASLFGIERRGYIRPGYYADLAVLRPETYTVQPGDLLYKCGWSPLEGEELAWRVVATYVNGARVYDTEKGVSDRVASKPLAFNKL